MCRRKECGMIIGLGQDMTDIRRIARTLDRFGDQFTNRVFTDVERAKSDRRRMRAASYAKRFAAKEAAAKALGTGVPRAGVSWRDIGVVNLPSGKPTLALTGGAAEHLARITPDGWQAHIHVSITDDDPYALAQVIIEAYPPDDSADRSTDRSKGCVTDLPAGPGPGEDRATQGESTGGHSTGGQSTGGHSTGGHSTEGQSTQGQSTGGMWA